MTEVTWAAANARRLSRHGLTSGLPSLVEAAAAMAGVHAQVMSAAELSLGIRVAGTTREDVAAALWERRTLVKTYGPRGTIHVLRAEDLPWWLAALGSQPQPFSQSDAVRLSPDETDAVVAALDEALRERDLTTPELDAAVADACGAWAAEESMPAFGGYWPRWRMAMRDAAVRGVLCFGPNQGRRVAFASPSRWLGDVELPDAVEAQRRLLRAYLTAYGPATPANLAQWLATSLPLARDIFALGDLEEVDLDSHVAWVWRGDTGFEGADPPAVRLLPYFDAFQVGSQPRDLLFPGRAAERALAGRQAGNFPVVLLDGVVGGVWHLKRAGKRIVITVEPLGRLTKAQVSRLEGEADRIAGVAEGRAEMTVGPVTVGPHA